MKLLVYGALGWIGQQFCAYLQEKDIKYHCGEARVYNIIDVRKDIEKIKPTHILSLIGRTSGIYNCKIIGTIDYLEQPGKLQENIRDNLFSLISLALLCREYNIHLTYVGTGCIFNYDTEHTTEKRYTEDDIPNFFGSSYTIVKGYTDQLMHLLTDTVLNLRIRMPISSQDHPRNFISKIISYDKICSSITHFAKTCVIVDSLCPLLYMFSSNFFKL
jgi:3,5-epimerase/4-reductase